ncbi:unnamed protein product [Paramecium sonneborni]|uniref:Uncharacterized protein n=1 Tax=Paramecium sonneborni TaxID=65129 RepID=A0A8S1KH48_9CILI|nr:unnamed protein product [Paramecium sonneborni]
MKKILLTLLFVSVCLCQEESLIQLENGVSLTNLNKLMTMDYNQLDCQTNLLQMSHQLKMWAELYQDEKVIHHEIRLLSTAHKTLNQQRFNRQRNSNTLHRAKRILAALRHNTHKKQHTIYQQWRVNEINQLKHSIQLLQTATSEEESKQCCDRIEQMVNKFLDERKHIAKQCGNADVTINIINDAEGKIQVINKKCKENDPDVKVNRVDSLEKVIVEQQQQQQRKEEQVIVGQSQQQKKEERNEKSETVTKTVTQETVEESQEETVIEETVTKTTSSKVVEIPDDDDDDVQEGELVSTQGIGASGEGGRT